MKYLIKLSFNYHRNELGFILSHTKEQNKTKVGDIIRKHCYRKLQHINMPIYILLDRFIHVT